MIFSYRTEIVVTTRLYSRANSYALFLSRLQYKSHRGSVRYVALADIADFYPRVYQHRLENIVETCATSERGRSVARVLVRKLISKLSDSNSYGIPIGPYASRILAEAVLIDVDSYLLPEEMDFVRWVDDYYFFTKTEEQAQEILFRLAQRLYEKHGLTLSALKTKIQSAAVFNRRFEADPDEEVDRRISTIQEFATLFDPYFEEEQDITDEQIAELTELNIAELVADALEDRDFVDYPTLSALLKHPVVFTMLPIDSRKNLGEVLLRNAPHLYPIAEDVARFFESFADQSWRDKKHVRNKLLASIRAKRNKWPPEYYIMWILDVFAQSEAWRHAPDFARIFRDHRSDLVRRMAALAIGANGSRADALETRDRYAAASPLEQLAILVATKRLGTDERRHWKTSLQLKGPLEKRI
jgi:Reverse transcriptase (RNA-dependent DNA polymerase)